MNAQRVKILHGHHGEAMVVGIAYHLKLNLLPSFKRLFHKNLLRICKSAFAVAFELFVVSAYAGPEASKGIA